MPERALSYRETYFELRRTGALFEADKITIEQWCASVHRILDAFRRGRARR